MRGFQSALLLFFFITIAPVLAHAQDGGSLVFPRVIVMPLENRAAARSLGVNALGYAATLAERLEAESALDVINGPLVLTPEQAQLVSPTGTGLDLGSANRLASERGATHFVTGEFRGQVWDMTYVVRIYAVDPVSPRLVGEGSVTGDLNEPGTVRQSSLRMHALLASATSAAFSLAGIPLSPATVASIAAPSTGDAYAYLLLSRAYARHFRSAAPSETASSDETALDIAEHAVLVDPTFTEAQRFYAHLLHEVGRNRASRAHFEVALERRPSDVRTLIELGDVELGERNPDIARGYLERAVTADPAHPMAHYWLGRAYLALGDTPRATAEFERARTIDSTLLAARRELVRLYADARRYVDAAAEISSVRAQDDDDIDAVFLLGACQRAAGRMGLAIGAYDWGIMRFRSEPRFHKFRADLLGALGRSAEARLGYEAARRIAPRDRRLAEILDTHDPDATVGLLGGGALVRVIAESVDRMERMETSRGTYVLAINDAILDLQINGAEACRDGHGASSALLAREEGDRYWALGQDMTTAADGIRIALRAGEGAALTPDEARNADAVIAAMDASERDVREMRSLFQTTFISLYRRHECETFDGPITAATPDSVRARYADRRVELPEVRPPTWTVPISPVVPSMPARSITFRVNNTDGDMAYVLTVDGVELGEVAAGRSATFSSRLGPHQICLVPRGTRCGDPGTRRTVFLYERWTIRVRPGSG